MAFVLSTTSFNDGDNIPERYSRDGEDVSPPLTWVRAPVGTHSFALIVHDPDAPMGDFTHWVLFNIPNDRDHLAEGEKGVGVKGHNDYGGNGYGGPQPPRGHGPHRYFFHLYALEADHLALVEGASRADVEAAMKGHILAEAQVMGRYERK